MAEEQWGSDEVFGDGGGVLLGSVTERKGLRSLTLATSCTAGIGSRASVCMTMGPSLGPELLVRDRIQLTE